MSTLQQARWESRWQRLKIGLILFAVVFGLAKLFSDPVQTLVSAIRSPQLPAAPVVESQVFLEQGWDQGTREEYHHISQGSRTLPVPYRWFAALAQPSDWAVGSLFASDDLFADPDYLTRFGFLIDQSGCDAGSYASWRVHQGKRLPKAVDCDDGTLPPYRAEAVDGNPRRTDDPPVPIGFSLSGEQPLDGLYGRRTAIGLTCAACHTGSLMHNGTQFIVEGGPGNADFGLFSKTLAAAIGQTLISSQLPVLDGRFRGFAGRVLGDADSPGARETLRKDMASAVAVLKQFQHRFEVPEGSGRLDALSRIGNRVFSRNMRRPDNYAPINAPVSYPHIWTASWFDWVQYDGSIMNPLVRNAGEALGVGATMNTLAGEDEGRLATGIPMEKLAWVETALRGSSFTAEKQDGLLAPKWNPDAFGAIDPDDIVAGRALYDQNCASCHLPAFGSAAFWSPTTTEGKTSYQWRPFKWTDLDGVEQAYDGTLLRLKAISLEQIGTDPLQSSLLDARYLDTTSRSAHGDRPAEPALGANAEMCVPVYTEKPYDADGQYADGSTHKKYRKRYAMARVEDSPSTAFGVALGAATTAAIEATFKSTGASPDQQAEYWTDRPNCFRTGAGYKARPLNGVWATGPFLHNGSVPTLDHLLGPVEDRPEQVVLGSPEFDTEKVGIKQPDRVRRSEGSDYDRNGRFVLDTRLPGNSNRGHEFSDSFDASRAKKPQGGVIGPALDADERRQLIAFLKTL